MRLRELLEGFDVAGWFGDPDVEVSSLVHDSRQGTPGACFACVRGAHFDGHDHAIEAVAAGAVALLVEHEVEGVGDVAQVLLPDVRAALGPLAARLHGEPSRQMRVAGVTGTNGKTTTTLLLAAIGEADGEHVATIGTLSGALTTPEATDLQASLASMRDDGVTMVAMEVSSHALVRHRVDGTHFRAACFTNLSHDHLDEHGTIEEYFEAKRLLFGPERTDVCVVNLDDSFGARLAAEFDVDRRPTVTYALHDPLARIGAESLSMTKAGVSYVLVDRESNERVEVSSSLLGEISVANQLAAAAIARALGIGLDVAARGLGAVEAIPGRLERFEGPSSTVLVDYAHTPDSLERVLNAAHLVGGHVTVVFGCGGNRDRTKRPMMGAIAARGADRVVLTDDNPRDEDPETIIHEIRSGMTGNVDVSVQRDRAAAIEGAIRRTPDGGVVVIAGKGHETTQVIGTDISTFDDRDVVREVLGRSPCA